MKNKAISFWIVLILIIAGGMVSVQAGNDIDGNKMPSGRHYNLNIIGVPHRMNGNFDGGNGARIFVSRTGITQFYVYGDDSTSYEVLDHDGTDGKVGGGVGDPGITFPYDETAEHWKCSIYVRLVGPKDSKIKWTTYYDWDGSGWLEYKTFNLEKSKKFSLKTSELLIDGFQHILWELEPLYNFRILQMRIYLE